MIKNQPDYWQPPDNWPQPMSTKETLENETLDKKIIEKHKKILNRRKIVKDFRKYFEDFENIRERLEDLKTTDLKEYLQTKEELETYIEDGYSGYGSDILREEDSHNSANVDVGLAYVFVVILMAFVSELPFLFQVG